MNIKKRNHFLRAVLVIALFTELLAADSSCITKEDLSVLDKRLIDFNKAIQNDDLKVVSSFINFPLTDNHNHAITKRVFLQEADYQPVINLKDILKTKFPQSAHEKSLSSYMYLDECNKHVLEKSYAGDKQGLRFIFKKIGADLQLKLISFAN